MGRADPERLAMRALARVFSDQRRFERAQRLARMGQRPFACEGRIVLVVGR